MLLLWLLLASLTTGTLIFAGGTRWVLAAVVAHGVVALGIVAVTPWKWRIMRRSMDVRPLRSTWPSVLLGVFVVITVLTGVLHSSGLVGTYGPFDDMQVHVVAAIATVPLTVWHLIARGNWPQRRDVSRRNLVRGGVVLTAAAAGLGSLEASYRLAGLRGARRRFTGSFEQGSGAPERMPSIIWLLDPRPRLDAGDWGLRIIDASGERRLDYDAVTAHDDRRVATIDCTVGWYAEQVWRGVDLGRLVEPAPGTRSIVVRSTTGYSRRFPVGDLPLLLLATGYGEQVLAARHGFPARLVAPGRRGFWWVKWVTEVEVSDDPWWYQPYFPLQ